MSTTMNRNFQLSLLLALCFHGLLMFGVSHSKRDVFQTRSEMPDMEVSLVETEPEEAQPPPPAPVVQQPSPVLAEPKPESPPETKPQPVVVSDPQPALALPVSESVTVSNEADLQVAATTNNIPQFEDAPLSSSVPPAISGPTIVKAQARYRYNPEPEYPLQAKRRRQQGLVLLTVLLDTSGAPAKIEVKESSRFPALDEAAVQAVQRWKFEPAMLNKQSVQAEVEVPVRFKLTR